MISSKYSQASGFAGFPIVVSEALIDISRSCAVKAKMQADPTTTLLDIGIPDTFGGAASGL
jgi:hypothetical protein